MTFYGRRKVEDHQPFKFPILCIVIVVVVVVTLFYIDLYFNTVFLVSFMRMYSKLIKIDGND